MRQTIVHALSLMLGAIAVFSSCSNETDLYNPTAADQVQHKQFKEAFEKTFGKVAPTVDWGFSDTESSTLTRARTVADRETISNEEICKLGAAEIRALPEAPKRAYLKQLVEESQDPVNIGTAFDIYELAAFGFKRIICEDLYVSNDCDFDYNDAVFDAKRLEEAGSSDYATFNVILRAEGAHKRIEVGQAQGKFEVHAAFNVGQQVFVNTVKKDRDIHTGAYWHKDKNPVVKIIKVAKKANGDEPTLIDIPVVVEGNSLPLRAETGEPAEKICVDLDYSWVEEREHMGNWYPQFSHYVSGTANTDIDDTFTDENAWWRDTEENLEWWEKFVSANPTPTPNPESDPTTNPEPDETTEPTTNSHSKVVYHNEHDMLILSNKFGAEVESQTREGNYVTVAFKSEPVAVAERAFYDQLYLWGMTIPKISIGKQAFARCTSMSTFSMNGQGDPDSSTSIGEEAFSGCTALQNFVFSPHLMEIGDKAFYNCNKLTTVDLPESILGIGENAFEDCIRLTYLRIGSQIYNNQNNVLRIKKNAFKGCTSLTTITCLATTPPHIEFDSVTGEGPFSSVVTRINVPNSSLNRYKEAWPYYSSILFGM